MKTALLVIDIQNDYFPDGKNELVNSLEASRKAKDLLEHFRQRNLPVVHIRHLSDYLQEQEIEHLVISGMMSHMCIDSTARAGKNLGYRITIAEDACATKDLTFQKCKIPALDIHRAFMAGLSHYYAEIKTSPELIEQFKEFKNVLATTE